MQSPSCVTNVSNAAEIIPINFEVMKIKEEIVGQPCLLGNYSVSSSEVGKSEAVTDHSSLGFDSAEGICDQYKDSDTHLHTCNKEYFKTHDNETKMSELQNNTCSNEIHSQIKLEQVDVWNAGLILKTEDKETKLYNTRDQSTMSSWSADNKRYMQSSVAHTNRLSVGHRNGVHDVNSQPSVVLDATSSLMYPVVNVIRGQCNICKDIFVSNLSLTHPVSYVHVCEMTADKLLVVNNLGKTGRVRDLHGRSQTGEKRFACVICSYRCNSNQSLSNHMRSHTGEKKFACSLCSFRCNTNQNLSTHMRTHTGEKPFACTICSFRCNTNQNLSTHMRTHTGEKPFTCAICSFRCNTNQNLSTHMRTHNNEKPFACTICSFRCNTNQNLSTHMRTHTCEKKIACTLCCYQCKNSFQLSCHMYRHTGKKPFACKNCSYSSKKW